MIKIKNIGKRLITFTLGDVRYPLVCGEKNELIVPDAVAELPLFKAFEKAGEVVNCGTVETKSERYLELQAETVTSLRAMAKDMYGISGTSRMKEDDLIKAIIEAEQE